MSIAEKTEKLPDLLKVSEVSDLVRFSQPTIKRWIRKGLIKGHQFEQGGEYRIDKNEVIRMMEKNV